MTPGDVARAAEPRAAPSSSSSSQPSQHAELAKRALTGRGWPRALLASDAVMSAVAVAAAVLGAASAGVPARGPTVWLFVPLALGITALAGGYRSTFKPRTFRAAWVIAASTSVAAMLITIIDAFAVASPSFPSLAGRAWVYGALFMILARLSLTAARRTAFVNGAITTRALIVGAGVVGARVERRLREQPDLGLRAVGYVDASEGPDEAALDRILPVLGGPEDFGRVIAETRAEHVIVAFPMAPDEQVVPLIREAHARGLRVSVVPRLFENTTVHSDVSHIGGLPVLGLQRVDTHGAWFAAKHAFDAVLATAGLLFLSPLLAVMAVAVWWSTGSVLFRQQRVGRDGRLFNVLKFRTMSGTPERNGEADAAWAAATVGGPPAASASASASASAQGRVTPVGALLRRHSLDELPQLINVVLGQMSLVGPRPERLTYVRQFERHVPRYADRHRVRPGLTGWAQVHGLRGNTSLTDRVEWDNHYIDNWSLGLDVKILLMTVGALRAPE